MPNFQGQLSEENVIQLIAYIKSLSSQTATASQVGALPTNGPQVPAPGKKQSAATKATALQPAQQ
jgi:hypothetical protein